jgi:arginine deiminase
MQNVSVFSEIARLKRVIVHTPGCEVEKMTPDNAERALYSDILNLDVAREEYAQFKGVLSKFCQVFEVRELLAEALSVEGVQHGFVETVTAQETDAGLKKALLQLRPEKLAQHLIEGVELEHNNLTRYLSDERYGLKPLHNFFFTRDSSMTVYNQIVLGRMASSVRERESQIMEVIFRNHPAFYGTPIFSPAPATQYPKGGITLEGGDLLVVSPQVLVCGIGLRTSTQGVDRLIDLFKADKKPLQHIIVQELPDSPESFIHLDMVFTMLDHDLCMAYEPLILSHNQYRTIHIQIRNGKVTSIANEPDLIVALAKTGIELKPVLCGGTDRWSQEREQWHSGANFLALAPGVVIGYERNKHTLDELSNNGFNIVKASEILKNNLPFPEKRSVITIAGSELARGGGGARCMSMPVERD